MIFLKIRNIGEIGTALKRILISGIREDRILSHGMHLVGRRDWIHHLGKRS